MLAFIKCLLLVVITQISTTTHASEDTLVHYDLKNGLAPYFWKNNNGEHIGIIPDIVARMKPYKLRFTEIPRKRLDDALISGQINFALMHPDYTEIDDKLNFIPTYFSQTKVLYQRLSDTTTPKHLSEIKNTTICARLGYKNPVIELVAEKQNIRIIRSPDNQTMVRMLLKDRCDYLVGSTHVIDFTLMKMHEKSIEKTKVRLAEKPFFFALPQNKVDAINEVKMHLEELKRTGELDRIVSNYTGS